MPWLNQNGSAMTEAEVLEMKSRAALAGIPKSEIADKMEALEAELDHWIHSGSTITGMRRYMAMKVLAPMIKILRLELFELAIVCAKQLNDQRAAIQREDFYQQFQRMVVDNRTFRSFLFEHFKNDLTAAESLNMPLMDLAKGILLRYKMGKDWIAPAPAAPPAVTNAPPDSAVFLSAEGK